MLQETPLLSNNVAAYNIRNTEWAKERIALQRGLGGAPILWLATDEDANLSPVAQARHDHLTNSTQNQCNIPEHAMLSSCYSPSAPDSTAYTNESGSDGAPFSGPPLPSSVEHSAFETSGLNVHNKQDEEESFIPLITSPAQLSRSPQAKAMVLGNVSPVWCPSPSVPIGSARIEFVESLMWNAIMRISWIYSLDLDPDRHFTNSRWLTQAKSRKKLPPPKELVHQSIIHALCDESALTPILHLLESPPQHRIQPGRLPWDHQGPAEKPAPAELIPFPLFVIEMSRRLKVSTFIFLTAIRWMVDLWESGILDGVREMENCGACKSGMLGCKHFAPGVLESIDLDGDGPGGIRAEGEERDWSYGRPFGVQKNVFNPKKAHQEKIRQAQERQRARMNEEAEKRAEEDRKAMATTATADPAVQPTATTKSTSVRSSVQSTTQKPPQNPFGRPKAVPLPGVIKPLTVLSPLADPKKAMLGALILANKFHRDRSGANKQFAASVGLGLESVSAAEKAINVALGCKLSRSWINVPQPQASQQAVPSSIAEPHNIKNKGQNSVNRHVLTLWPLTDVNKLDWEDGSCDPSYAESMLGWGKADMERIGVKALREASAPAGLPDPINVSPIISNVQTIHTQARVKLQELLDLRTIQNELDETVWVLPDYTATSESVSIQIDSSLASSKPQLSNGSTAQPIPYLHQTREYPAGLPRFDHAALMLEDLVDDIVPALPPTPKVFTHLTQMPLAQGPSAVMKRKHSQEEPETTLPEDAPVFKRQRTEVQSSNSFNAPLIFQAKSLPDVEMVENQQPLLKPNLLIVSDSEDTPALSGAGSQSTTGTITPLNSGSAAPSRAGSVSVENKDCMPSINVNSNLANHDITSNSLIGVTSWLAKLPHSDSSDSNVTITCTGGQSA